MIITVMRRKLLAVWGFLPRLERALWRRHPLPIRRAVDKQERPSLITQWIILWHWYQWNLSAARLSFAYQKIIGCNILWCNNTLVTSQNILFKDCMKVSLENYFNQNYVTFITFTFPQVFWGNLNVMCAEVRGGHTHLLEFTAWRGTRSWGTRQRTHTHTHRSIKNTAH